jgi:SAM-dependent methyltransferase
MPGVEISKYYDATEDRETRSDLAFALSIMNGPKIAVDCGCGAGADIDYLLANDFKVYGFDIEDESISRCKTRFKNQKDVVLSIADFASYDYPKASLVVADASLFFCPRPDFNEAWKSMSGCLHPEGVFCGSFLGPLDSMAGPTYDKSVFWPDVTVFNETEVKAFFKGFEIRRFTEHKTSGNTPQGTHHDWHIFSVVAKKSNK